MIKMIEVEGEIKHSSNQEFIIEYDNDVDCPYCSQPNIHNALFAYMTVRTDNDKNIPDNAYLLYKCAKCKQVFMAVYYVYYNPYRDKMILQTSYHRTVPNPDIKIEFPKEIFAISERFVKIYNNALAIENLGDNDSAGMVYRKALEFLIKDYLVSFKGVDKANFKNKGLSQIIDEYFHNEENLKYTAKLSTWIGNDFAHYESVNNLNITDMKDYLDAFVYFIQYNLIAATAKKLAHKPK